MKRAVIAAIIAGLLAPAALAQDPYYAVKMIELTEKVDAAGRETASAVKVDDYATACASSKQAAKLMDDYVALAFQHREALYAETNMTPEQLELSSNEKILPLILSASRMKKTSSDLCAKVGTTD